MSRPHHLKILAPFSTPIYHWKENNFLIKTFEIGYSVSVAGLACAIALLAKKKFTFLLSHWGWSCGLLLFDLHFIQVITPLDEHRSNRYLHSIIATTSVIASGFCFAQLPLISKNVSNNNQIYILMATALSGLLMSYLIDTYEYRKNIADYT